MGQIPFRNFFYKILHGEGVPDPYLNTKFYCCGIRSVGLQAESHKN